MRLLHISDLHLGKKDRDEDILLQLEKVVGVCLSEGVDILLITGDLFDVPSPPRATKEAFLEVVEPLRQRGVALVVVAICGNHDRGGLGGWDREGLLFFEEPEVLRFGELRLHLFPFHPHGSGKDLLKGGLQRASRYEVALCHASYVSNPAVLSQLGEDGLLYYPLTSTEVRNLPFDYLALGHYHNPMLWKEGACRCGYPGTIEPLSFKEEGPRKAFLVLCEGELRVEEVDLGCRRAFRTMPWRVGVEVKEEEVPLRLRELRGRRDFFKVVLTGFVRDGALLRASLQGLADNVKVDWRVIDLQRVEADPLLKGFFELVRERDEGDERLLGRGLELLEGHVD